MANETTEERAVPESGSGSSHPWLATSYPDDVNWHKSYTATPIPQLLDTALSKYADKPCINFLGRRYTYGNIGNLVDRAAAGLQKQGIGKGTKVGLLLPNSPTFVVYFFAALKAGATVVNFNPLYSHDELTYQVKDSGTEVMITLDLKMLFGKVERLLLEGGLKKAVVCSFPALLPTAKGLLFRAVKSGELANVKRSAAIAQVVQESQLLDNDGRYDPVAIDPHNDIAVLQYTGGTTGTPKGAMLSHANLTINVAQVCDWAPELVDAEERVFAVLPFFHIFAMTVVMNFAIARAAEMIMMPRFVLDDALKLINKTRPTVMPGVPTLFNAIINHQKLASYDLSSLKFCLSGGAPLPIEVKNQFQDLTGCRLVEGYGLSETSPVLTCNPLNGPAKAGSIGLPLPQTLLSLRDLSDPSQEVPPGEKGEVCAAGPQVMKGYWNKPEETANAFTGEYFRTGDVAIMDEDGFFFIVDRIKDLIICSGYNVYPRRIEEALYEYPAVEEVTVIGIPDDYRGEAPKAFVKLRKGHSATHDELMAHLTEKLSKIELPAEIEFRDELPKTMIGKLSKKELKQEESERQTAKT